MYAHALPATKERVTIIFEDAPLQVEAGISVAAAVLHAGTGATRKTHKHDERAPYCHMGVCYECLMEIDGVPNQQACLVPVREGLRVKRQNSVPSFAPEKAR